jgi:hypothetical protein
MPMIDEFALMAASQLLHMLHEHFARKDYLDPSEWDLANYDWKAILEKNAFTREIVMIVNYMPECIPFNVRATLF